MASVVYSHVLNCGRPAYSFVFGFFCRISVYLLRGNVALHPSGLRMAC